jgi:predicted nuclease of predicted toxin-antitoxin system
VAALIFDEQIASPRIVQALTERGIEASTIGDFGVQGRPDPDVVRRVADEVGAPWVLVTMDLTIVEDHEGFGWERYAIAWIRVREGIVGSQVEREKTDIVQRRAHEMVEQNPGDHHTYTVKKRFKHPPSLASLMRNP